MRSSAPKRWRCLISLLAVLILIALLAAAVAVPVMARHEFYRDNIDQARRNLVRYRRIIDEAPALRAEIERLLDAADSTTFYLSETTAALAAAELQEMAKEVVRANGGTLTSTQVLQTRGGAQGSDGRVMIRVQMSGDTEALQRVVYALESGQPLLFVDKLTVQARPRARGRTRVQARRRPARAKRGTAREPGPAPTVKTALTVSFDLSGYRVSGDWTGLGDQARENH